MTSITYHVVKAEGRWCIKRCSPQSWSIVGWRATLRGAKRFARYDAWREHGKVEITVYP